MGNKYRIIIDGYNLIFQCGLEGVSRRPVALERARDRLLTELTKYLSESRRARTAIVFDAKRLPIKETEAISEKHGVTVYFAVDYEDADSLIEQLILKNSTPKRLVVVSSDHRIQKAALRRKATPIDSDVWYDRLDRIGNQGSSATKPGPSEEKADLEELKKIDWAAEFGFVEPSESSVSSGDANETGPKDATFNPFPPGYADDLLDEPSDEN